MLNNYRVVDLKEGLRSKRLPVAGLKVDLIKRLADANVWPPQELLDQMSDVARERHIRAPILAVMSVAAGEAWLTASR